MKLKYTQDKSYGCALYAVANIFPELENYVTEERIEKSKKGLLMGHLSKWLQDDGKDWSIDVWYYDHEGKDIPDKFFGKYLPEGDNILPALFAVDNEGKLNHTIGGHIYSNETIEIFDSLEKESKIIPFREVNQLYDNVRGFYCFIDMNDPGGYVQFLS